MKIGEYRKRAQLTQEALANKLNVDPSAITKWETGAAAPTAAKLPKIAEALGCTIDDLFGNEKSAG